jgi:glycosyltransferase involved in cell wall biosynthesis
VRILHLAARGHAAGSSISITALARAQRAAGHEVVIGCPGESWLASRAREAGLEVAPLEIPAANAEARGVAALASDAGPDVINAHSSPDRRALRALRIRGRLRAALVTSRRAMPRSSLVSALLDSFTADRVIAVSNSVARALVRRGVRPSLVRVVPNAVDLLRVDRTLAPGEVTLAREAVARGLPGGTEREAGALLEENAPLVGIVSRAKDHATALRALRHVATPLTLVCLGASRDADLAGLAAMAAPHRVSFLPFTDDPLPFYQLFDCCLLPTLQEGLSQSLLEAMALGKCVITTATGGNLDLLTHGVDGLLVPPASPAALAREIERALGDPALREGLGAAARSRARRDFTIARTAALTEAVYAEALERRAA